MKSLVRIFKIFIGALLTMLVLVNLLILISGKLYLYKGLVNTYFKGRTNASITDYPIFVNRTVAAGKSSDWPLSTRYNKKEISAEHLTDFERLGTIAYLVVQHDSILHEEYWGGYSDTSHTGSFSMAKTFISILVGIAIDEGKLKSVDEPVATYLPEFLEGKRKNITIKHLLTMSSGMNFDESYKNPIGFAAEAYYGDDLRKLIFKYDAVDEPGQVFNYLSGNTQLLGFVLKQATGMSVSEYASQKLWQPIQAKQDAYWSLDHVDGDEKAYCCFNSNAKDFARIGKLFLDSGKWNGSQVISTDYVLASICPSATLDKDLNSQNERYGYSWWLMPKYKGHFIYYARGIQGQYIIMIPDLDVIIVRLGQAREASSINGHPTDFYRYIDVALELIGI